MKRSVIIKKCVVFLVIFFALFVLIQHILKYKWENHEFISTRFECYENENKDTIDVLFFGTSRIYAGITPMIMWNDVGLSGMNFGTSLQNAMCNYYLLEYSLLKQTPKVIVLELDPIFEDRKADEKIYESTYRKIAETLPDDRLRIELIENIVMDNNEQDRLSYYLPILRYHERWSEISSQDFKPVDWYKEYFKGGLLNNVTVPVKIDVERIYDLEKVAISNSSEVYYKKIVDRCREKGIEILCISTPQFSENLNYAKFDIIEEWCNKHGVKYINYNDEEYQNALNLNLECDYYDNEHLNINGSIKLTRDIGQRIQKIYNIENHINDNEYINWNIQWK